MSGIAISNPTDRLQRGGGSVVVNSDGSISLTPLAGQALSQTGAATFTAPASWSAGATNAGWHQVNTTLVDGGTTVGQAAGQTSMLTIAVQAAPFAGNVAAMNVVTNSGAQTSNLTGITRAFIANYNIQMAGGTLNQFESGAFVAAATAGATGTVSYGYCLSGEFLHPNTGGLTMTVVDGTLGNITLQSSGNIATARGVYGYVQDTSGQTGTFSTLGVGVNAAFLHNAATTWPEAWGVTVSGTSSGAGAIMTLGGGIKVSLRGNTTGLWTNAYGLYLKSPVNSTGSFTNLYGARIDNQGGSATAKAIGLYIADQANATSGNVSLVLGSTSAPSGTWCIYSNSVNKSQFAGDVIMVGTATSMVTGFGFLAAGAGAPTGVPTNYAANVSVPMYYDSTNNFLYIYSGGAWKKSTVYA